MSESTKEIAVNESVREVQINENAIKNLIYIIRGQQVMLDSDLAMLYHVETFNLNKAMKRNVDRFPEDFCFQLTKEEYKNLIFQSGISSLQEGENKHGGRRKLPYVFTEQGISMLSAVLRSEIAVKVSVRIMRTFVEMRRFMANNSLVLSRINELEVKQLSYQKETDDKFEQVFHYISEHEEVSQKIFFEGQIYDAFSLLTELIAKAKKEIVLIDNYVDVGTLNILAKKQKNVKVQIYTVKRTRLSQTDINNFNQQYPTLSVDYTEEFHDRFLIIDETLAYHVGASLKDAGKKCFAINRIEDKANIIDILNRIKKQITEGMTTEENKINAITKEKTDVLKDEYKHTLELLDAYDHQTLTCPEGTYYDGNETIEEVAVGMLYDMIKNPVWYDCNKQMAAIKFLLFLEWNNALFVDGEKRISDTLLVALILMIEKSRDEDKEMIIRTVLNCIC